jgi:hypothetical protein
MRTRIEYAIRWNFPDGTVPPGYISHESSTKVGAQIGLDDDGAEGYRQYGRVVHRTVTISDWEE